MKYLMTALTSLMIVSSTSFADSDTAAVTTARIAELAAHRVDRLVALKKIDASFLKKTSKLEVASVSNEAPVAYKAIISQTAPADGKPVQLELSFDAAGKALAFKLVAGGTAGPDAGWPDKNSVSLMESALHYLAENTTDSKLAPFFEGLSSMELTKGKLDGQTVAQATVSSTKIAQKLNVFVKLDGTVISSEVVP